MKHSGSGHTLTDFILEVFRLNGRLLAAGDQMTRPAGQTSARWQVLGAIDTEARTVSQIARVMGLTRQSVQRTADRLQEEGVVSYADNPAHRRSKLVALTTRGRSILDGLTQRQILWANDLGASLGESEVRRALLVARRFRELLEHAARSAGAARTQGRPSNGRRAIVREPRRSVR